MFAGALSFAGVGLFACGRLVNCLRQTRDHLERFDSVKRGLKWCSAMIRVDNGLFATVTDHPVTALRSMRLFTLVPAGSDSDRPNPVPDCTGRDRYTLNGAR
ncbi:hypothetical protein M514_10425 [Trichuris suis]|uniref:Uncharacterized protein n=1 Tax=Trichuris suis TaxID=68888 RepID=A0A085NIK5_9BILA|nr:hypothetical protein M513_10425 [Trichuris suis]KFD69301.1 hypothetical protein M514_10425 [Trichuris suis]